MDKTICEEHVFYEVHRAHAVALRNFLFYRVGSLEKARDLVQDTFIKLWSNCHKVSLEKARSYLFTVANRLFLDDADHQKVALKFQYRHGVTERHTETSPEYLYRQEEFKQRLEKAISGLPEMQRTVFLMSRIDKMPNKEIAETLQLSVKTIEKHITSSLTRLKEKLDDAKHLKL